MTAPAPQAEAAPDAVGYVLGDNVSARLYAGYSLACGTELFATPQASPVRHSCDLDMLSDCPACSADANAAIAIDGTTPQASQPAAGDGMVMVPSPAGTSLLVSRAIANDAAKVQQLVDALMAATPPTPAGAETRLSAQLREQAAYLDKRLGQTGPLAAILRDAANDIDRLTAGAVRVDDAERVLDALDDACVAMNHKHGGKHRVSWYCYTREQRLEVMRAALAQPAAPSDQEAGNA